jgi:hypothetical protein
LSTHGTPRNIVFLIDVEPDERKAGPGGSWEGSAIAFRELGALRTRLQEKTGAAVRFNWMPRFDPQIEHNWKRRDWVVHACPELLPTIAAHGDFAGIHVHLWRWHHRHGDWFTDSDNLDWRAECFGRSVEGYRSVFGSHPVASRFGDRSLLHQDVALLRQHGIRYDLTVEPGSPACNISGDTLASPMPDYRRAPRLPYQPSAADYLTPAPHTRPEGLWLVPLSVSRRPHWVPVRSSPFMRSAVPFNLVLRPRRVSAEFALQIACDAPEPVVCVLRSGDLANPAYRGRFRRVVERLLGHPAMARCRFTGVDSAIADFAARKPKENSAIESCSL